MRNIRIYTETPLAVSSTVLLSKVASHHLLRVLRCRSNDRLTLFNGLGGSYRGRIVSTSARAVEVEILEFVAETAEPGLLITLALGISRNLHMDYAVQKSVELGVHAIVPLFTGRSTVKLDDKRVNTRMEHWRKIMIHACEQSGRNNVPALHAARELPAWVSGAQCVTRLLLAPSAPHTLTRCSAPDGGEVSVLIGPEGGLTDSEERVAQQHGYMPIRLGPRTLRTETAAVAALTALQTLWGDLR